MNTHFKIIVSCHNAERWIESCLKSISIQDYSNFQAIIIDDVSTDYTYQKIKQYNMPQNINVVSIKNDTKTCLLANTIKGINISKPSDEDVILFLDGDDWLAHSGVLSYLNNVYSNENIWITWGSYVLCSSGNVNFNASYTDCIGGGWAKPIKKDVPWNPRVDWRYSHLKTSKYFLWKNIHKEDFIWSKTNNYYPAATDAACMFPMLDMAGATHSKYIKEILYVYNIANPSAWNKKDTRHIQQQCYGEISRRNNYDLVGKELLV